MIEKLGLLKKLENIPAFLSRIYVMFVVIIGFVIFNSTDLKVALDNILGLFGVGATAIINHDTIYYLLNYLPIFILGIIFSTPIVKNIVTKVKKKLPAIINLAEPVILAILLIICISFLIDGSFNPFLYFRF